MANAKMALSPMAGFTDAPMRLICSRFDAARTYTEMVNAAGLARDGDASWALLETLPGEPKPFAHLYGSNPDEFSAARRSPRQGAFPASTSMQDAPPRRSSAKVQARR